MLNILEVKSHSLAVDCIVGRCYGPQGGVQGKNLSNKTMIPGLTAHSSPGRWSRVGVRFAKRNEQWATRTAGVGGRVCDIYYVRRREARLQHAGTRAAAISFCSRVMANLCLLRKVRNNCLFLLIQVVDLLQCMGPENVPRFSIHRHPVHPAPLPIFHRDTSSGVTNYEKEISIHRKYRKEFWQFHMNVLDTKVRICATGPQRREKCWR